MRRNHRVLVGLGAVCTSLLSYTACGSDEESSGGTGTPDASFDSKAPGSDSSTPQPDAAKSDGNVIVVDAGSDSQQEVDAGPWCGADAGTTCVKGEWFNYSTLLGGGDSGIDASTQSCIACPAAPITCSGDFILPDGGPAGYPPTYDTGTHNLTITLPPARAQLIEVSGATVVVADCYGASKGGSPQSVPATIVGDQVRFDLSGLAADASGTVTPCGAISLTMKDACCTTSTVTVTAFWDGELNRFGSASCPDGG